MAGCAREGDDVPSAPAAGGRDPCVDVLRAFSSRSDQDVRADLNMIFVRGLCVELGSPPLAAASTSPA
jgi:hypothetical protein